MSKLVRLIALLNGIGLAAAAGVGEAPPKELVQYIQDAGKLGLSDSQIRQNALKAGWAADIIANAMASAHESSAEHRELEKQADAAANPAAASVSAAVTPSLPAATDRTPAPVEPALAIPAAPNNSSKGHGVPEDYQIGAGDVLQIAVWKEPEASVAGAVVRPDGKITMPLIKEISVSGMTPTEAEKYIAGRLSDLIAGADVTVIVREIHSKKIYLIGAVKREGPMAYTYRMNVVQALSEAGGLTDYAKRKKIYVLRTEKGKDYRFPVDYDSVLKGEHMEMNIPLLPGDTIVVPH
jgi:polysaccharide export outer membrane protein